MGNALELRVILPKPHPRQSEFVNCDAKRIMVKAGRRSGKTFGVSIMAARAFLNHKHVIYATPTATQLDAVWNQMLYYFREPIEAGYLKKNEGRRTIELPGTEIKFKGKTAWNADTMRGGYGDLIIMDEFQMMHEGVWDEVIAPMLIDNDGTAVFTFTPPSLRNRLKSRASDKMYASKLFRRHLEDTDGRWKCFSFTSLDNPYISQDAVQDIAQDMSPVAYRQEILAEDIDEAPGAAFKRETIERNRVYKYPVLDRIVIGIDPGISKGGDNTGIVVAGVRDKDIYVLGDHTIDGSPMEWAQEVYRVFGLYNADLVVVESNQGGEMVAQTLQTVAPLLPIKQVHAWRDKMTRAEPISILYEKNIVHHVGSFPLLEDEMCLWMPGDHSPDRMDALVYAIGELSSKVEAKMKAEMLRY